MIFSCQGLLICDIVILEMKMSKKPVSLFFIVFSFIFLSGCTLPFFKKKKAALQVEAAPKATVFLDGDHIGQTPFFNENLKPGEYTLKLVPEADEGDFLSWQGVVKLNPGIMTVVKRTLASSESKTSGYILTLEPIGEKEEIKISVISTPDSAVVNLDGEPKGFTPLVLDNVVEGERLLTVSSPGFEEQEIRAKAIKGYKLMINVQLAKEESPEEEKKEKEKEADEESSPSAEASEAAEMEENKEASEAAEMEKPYVKIKDTPTGWLNVRSEPSTAKKDETVLTKVNPGEIYKFIEANEAGWYKIEYEKGKQGWISGKYATLYR